MIALAARNLHQPEVLTALVEALPRIQDSEARRSLLAMLLRIDTSRFENLASFHTALLEVFNLEKERRTRAALLERLAEAVHQDERMVPLFLETLAQPTLSDQEKAAVMAALSRLPAVSPEIAALTLQRARTASAAIQETAIAVAERCVRWNDALIGELRPYLGPNIDRRLRLRILRRLVGAKSLSIDFFPSLRDILRQDPDPEARSAALEMVQHLKDWDENAGLQLLWTAANDADERLRARAVRLLSEAPDLSDQQLEGLAGQLGHDDAAGTRIQILGMLRGRLGQPSLRAVVAGSYAESPSAFDRAELECLLDLLAPYASRDEALRRALLSTLPQLRQAAQRRLLMDKLLPYVRPDDVVESLVAALAREHQPELRGILFDRLKPLSVVKHPELLHAYCLELADPGSPFRLQCAVVLAGVLDTYPEVTAAFEDVLLYDQGRELIRTCLDGYLKPALSRRVEVLLAVVANEALDPASRQDALNHIESATLSPEGRERLDALLASPAGRSLRLPR
jgi:hypothetical protein